MITEPMLIRAKATLADFISSFNFQKSKEEKKFIRNITVRPEQLQIGQRNEDYVEFSYAGWQCYLVENAQRADRIADYLKIEKMYVQVGHMADLSFIIAQSK